MNVPAKATQSFLIGFLRRDYGAAGLYDLFRGPLASPATTLVTEIQVVVSLVTLTLFVPCIANFFMIIKEKSLQFAVLLMAFVIVLAVSVGAMLNFVLRALQVTL